MTFARSQHRAPGLEPFLKSRLHFEWFRTGEKMNDLLTFRFAAGRD
jgi:hypothetical protein